MAKKPNINEFAKICKRYGGIISNIANSFGVSRKYIYAWCEKDEAFKEALEDSRETFLDTAESNLQLLVKGIPKTELNEQGQPVFAGWQVPPSESAIVFVLKTIGKKRGYTERSEIDLNNNIKGSISVEEWIKDRTK